MITRAISSAGSEHLVYTEGVGGSNPSSPTRNFNRNVGVFLIYSTMDFIVYILFSELKNKYYVDFTSDIEGRIKRRNQKSKGFSGAVNDW
jgi:hypothetical protein